MTKEALLGGSYIEASDGMQCIPSDSLINNLPPPMWEDLSFNGGDAPNQIKPEYAGSNYRVYDFIDLTFFSQFRNVLSFAMGRIKM